MSATIVPGKSVGFDVLVPSGSIAGKLAFRWLWSRNDCRLTVNFSRMFEFSWPVTLQMEL